MQWLFLLELFRTRHIIDFYQDFRVNTIFTNDIAVALDHISRDPVQLIIIDDSVKEASSRQGMKNITTDTQDVKLMKSYMTDRAYDELGKLTYRMFMQYDNTAKGDSIVTIPISGEEKTCGRFHLDYIKPFLRKVDEQLTDGAQFYFNREGALDALMRDKVWKKKAKAFFISLTYPDLTQAEIGKKVGYTSHDQVSKAIKSVRGELSRIGGEEYEKYKTAELVPLDCYAQESD